MTRKIRIENDPKTYNLNLDGTSVSDAARAKELIEGDYAPVLYFETNSLNMEIFEKSDKVTHCPFKGDATHFHAVINGKRFENVAWMYENPIEAASDIKSHLAFYPLVEISSE